MEIEVNFCLFEIDIEVDFYLSEIETEAHLNRRKLLSIWDGNKSKLKWKQTQTDAHFCLFNVEKSNFVMCKMEIEACFFICGAEIETNLNRSAFLSFRDGNRNHGSSWSYYSKIKNNTHHWLAWPQISFGTS